jgi:hypothetical protein
MSKRVYLEMDLETSQAIMAFKQELGKIASDVSTLNALDTAVRGMVRALGKDELSTPDTVLDEVVEVLWPDGDTCVEWDSSTTSDIANILTAGGYGPLAEEEDEDDRSDVRIADDTCPSCIGTGIGQEGPPDTSTCRNCRGTGVRRPVREED